MRATSSNPDKDSSAPKSAEELFSEFLKSSEGKEEVSFKRFCEDHPDRADALRGLYSVYLTPETADASADTRDFVGQLYTAPAPENSLPTVLPGTSIGPYRLTSELGRGSFGIVYLAEQEKPLRRKVALKLLKPGMDSAELLQRFDAERQALARMDHAYVAKVYDAGRTPSGQSYFVMEYFPGEPLLAYCERHALPIRKRLGLFMKICDGVQHAHHQAAVLHRDLKPANILVAEDPDRGAVPKIIDFGLVKAIQEPLTDKSIHTGIAILGTLEYMSPEQAELSDIELDGRTDIYSLGVILYELLTGTLPISTKKLREAGLPNIPKLKRQVELETPRSRLIFLKQAAHEGARDKSLALGTRLKQFGKDLDWITLKALETERTRRYATVGDFRADIERYLQGESVTARPPSPIYRARKFVRKHRVATFSIAGTLVLLLVFALVSHLLSRAEKLNLVRSKRAEGEASWQEYERHDGESWKFKREWENSALRRPLWLPVWDRADEIKEWHQYLDARQKAEEAFAGAIQSFQEGLRASVSARHLKTEIRRLLGEIYYTRYQEAIRKDGIKLPAGFFRGFLTQLVDDRQDAGQLNQQLTLQTAPPGARVYCFQYSLLEGRLYPYPFHPKKGIVGEPFLQVNKISPDEAECPFRKEDRILTVGEKSVKTLTELAKRLKAVGKDEALQVKILRGGKKEDVVWTPFPSRRVESLAKTLQMDAEDRRYNLPSQYKTGASCLIRPYLQFGFSFAAYPIDASDASPENLLGVTTAGKTLSLELPEGSYLLLIKKDSHEDTRLPLAVPLGDDVKDITVKLVPEESVPAGFVYIPAGILATGGDSKAFNSMESGTYTVPSFFIGCHEVTVREWLQFTNDPLILQKTDDDGMLVPQANALRAELPHVDGGKVRIIPYDDANCGGLCWSKASQGWDVSDSVFDEDWPILGISHLAALEYVHWMSEKAKKRGEPWRFRLPTNVEWERAARGMDRRFFPWGDYNIWSFSWNLSGNYLRSPQRVGVSPFDESVFGVHDLAGSVLEHIGETLPGTENRYYRGGHWECQDDQFLRVSSRHSMLPVEGDLDCGLRVVAYLE